MILIAIIELIFISIIGYNMFHYSSDVKIGDEYSVPTFNKMDSIGGCIPYHLEE